MGECGFYIFFVYFIQFAPPCGLLWAEMAGQQTGLNSFNGRAKN